MAKIKPIRALRFTSKAGNIAKCVCPPYDIISPEERESLIASNENNLVRLELPLGEDRYDSAGRLLKKWMDEGIIARDESEGIFVYREEFSVKGRSYALTGLICLVELREFADKVILPHEETLTKAKTDRFNLMCATNCNFSSVYLLYNDDGSVADEWSPITNTEPLARFTDSEQVTHILWKIEDGDTVSRIMRLFEQKQLFIADGHHRYETALNFKKHLIANGMPENSNSDYIMATLVSMDDGGLVVFPTHRMIVDMPVCPDTVAEKCSEYFDCARYPMSDLDRMLASGENGHVFAMYTGGDDFLLLKAKKELDSVIIDGRSRAYSELDVSILHSFVLEKALGIDKENMANQVNLRYTRSEDEACESVREGRASAAFIINATKVSQIKEVSLAGDKMPQKSTYFYPKLKTGLVMNILEK